MSKKSKPTTPPTTGADITKGTNMDTTTENTNGADEQNTNQLDTANPNGTDNDSNTDGNVSGANDSTGDSTGDTQQTQEDQGTLITTVSVNLSSGNDFSDALTINALGTVDNSIPIAETQLPADLKVTDTPTEKQATVAPEVVVVGTGYTGDDVIIAAAFRSIDEYIVKMGPARMQDELTGGRNQRSLRQAILAVINTADETNYEEVYNVLFNKLADNAAGVFHEYNRLRFVEAMGLPAAEVSQWSRFLTGLVDLSNRASRSLAIQQIDVANMLAEAKLSAGAVNQLSTYLGA